MERRSQGKLLKRIIQHHSGFTLIEIMMVLLIIGLMGGIILPRINLISDFNLRSSTQGIVSFFRFSYDTAVSSGNIHRILYDIDKNEISVSYLEEKELLPSEEEKKNLAVPEPDEKKDNPPPKFTFSGDFQNYEDKILTLPKSVHIKGVYTGHSDKLIDKGQAFTLFFKNGFVEKTYLYLEDSAGGVYTITVNSVTGNATIYNEEIAYEEQPTS